MIMQEKPARSGLFLSIIILSLVKLKSLIGAGAIAPGDGDIQ
jgi:hypothetical protein